MREPEGQLLRPEIEVFVLVAVRLYRDGIADALGRDPPLPRRRQRRLARGRRAQQLERLPRPPDVALVDLGLPEGAGA